VLVELSPSAYLALCGLVRDAQSSDSDAGPLLEKVARELAQAMAGGLIPAEIAAQPERLEALRRAGFISQS